jgi:HSP20 family protein
VPPASFPPSTSSRKTTKSSSRPTCRASARKTEEVKEEGRYHFERSSGSFQRSIALPAEVDAEKIKAEFKDGVLTIEAPKSAAVLPHRVEISAN